MSLPIIGLDFGNFNSFTCCITDREEGKRMGGIPRDLLPSGRSDGIPSVYYYSERIGELCGENAVTSRARPVSNRIRYLKKNLGRSIELDGKQISYDDAITKVIQHCIRSANERMNALLQVQSDQIYLSYPVTYSFPQLQKLIELAQRATLADGTHVKVCGTIREPAAAALEYLSSHADAAKDTTVLIYDLGGGTFDLALVSAYPSGRTDAEGDMRFYDIISLAGLDDVGGKDFDDVIYRILVSKLNEMKIARKTVYENKLREDAETRKKELSSDEITLQELLYEDEVLEIEITRDEFEKASSVLLERTINETKSFLGRHPNQAPELILLTGGASLMPMVKKSLEKALPAYRGKIISYMPERAVAYGAARYGAIEKNHEICIGGNDEKDSGQPVEKVIQRTAFDFGIEFYNKENDKRFIHTVIPAGTPIPFENGAFLKSFTKNDHQEFAAFKVYEAIVQNPDQYNITGHYKEIMRVKLCFGRVVPEGTPAETKLSINKLGILKIVARDPGDPTKNDITNQVKVTLIT